MATNPRIAYDVVANAEGEADVNRLAAALEKVDDALDPVAAKRAQELSAELRELSGQKAAFDEFLRTLAESNSAAKALDEAQQAAARLGRRLESLQNPTKVQAGQLEKLRDAAATAQQAFDRKTESLNQARVSLQRVGVAETELGVTQEALTARINQTRLASQELVQRYQQTATAAEQSGTKQVAANAKVAESTASIGQQLSRLQGLAAAALGGSVAGQLAGDVAKVADQYNNLAARIRLVTGEGQAFNSAFQGVFDVATRTGAALESTGTLFARIAEAGKSIGVGQREALALTESINQAVQISGASAQASDAAITQLIQGLQSGVLRGEEFNSVMEQAPRLAKALAEGLGVTTGELRKLAEQGALTSDVVIRALQGQAATLRAEFETLPATVGRALQNLQTEWTRYIGEVDKSTGASQTAAKAIEALAQNIGTLVEALRLAGEAWIAYKLLDVAGTLARQTLGTKAAAAATLEATGATAANTAATAANTAAQTANARAQAGVAATLLPTATAAAQAVGVLGRLAGVFGLVVTAATLFGDAVTSAFGKLGTAIGEGAARLLGYRDRSNELAEAQRFLEERTAAAAAAQAEQTQRMQLAEEAALGLGVASKAIVAEFEKVTREGSSSAQALEKVRKALDLGDVQGITAAVTALDVLERKARITGDQVREALGDALKGRDLAVFEANARAAFDSSAQGVRRLQEALDAMRTEALRRAGTSLEELATGFGAAATSAINDVDALQEALKAAGADATDTGRLLAGALDKALAAANTERAVKAVIDRLVELGEAGTISGKQMADGLEVARRKLDELRPGINSLDEALRSFGLKTRAELLATADTLGQAYRTIAQSTTVSLEDKARAFDAYSKAAKAANNGVETSEVALQRAILETQLSAAGLGKTISTSMESASADVRKATDEIARFDAAIVAAATKSAANNPFSNDGRAARNAAMSTPSTTNEGGTTSPVTVVGAGGGITGRTPAGSSVGEVRFAVGAFDKSGPFGSSVPNVGPGEIAGFGGIFRRPVILPAPAAPPAPAPAPEGGRTVNINLGGRTQSIRFADQASADALIRLLEDAARAAGGP